MCLDNCLEITFTNDNDRSTARIIVLILTIITAGGQCMLANMFDILPPRMRENLLFSLLVVN